jgi:hypothetical protein
MVLRPESVRTSSPICSSCTRRSPEGSCPLQQARYGMFGQRYHGNTCSACSHHPEQLPSRTNWSKSLHGSLSRCAKSVSARPHQLMTICYYVRHVNPNDFFGQSQSIEETVGPWQRAASKASPTRRSPCTTEHAPCWPCSGRVGRGHLHFHRGSPKSAQSFRPPPVAPAPSRSAAGTYRRLAGVWRTGPAGVSVSARTGERLFGQTKPISPPRLCPLTEVCRPPPLQ